MAAYSWAWDNLWPKLNHNVASITSHRNVNGYGVHDVHAPHQRIPCSPGITGSVELPEQRMVQVHPFHAVDRVPCLRGMQACHACHRRFGPAMGGDGPVRIGEIRP